MSKRPNAVPCSRDAVMRSDRSTRSGRRRQAAHRADDRIHACPCHQSAKPMDSDGRPGNRRSSSKDSLRAERAMIGRSRYAPRYSDSDEHLVFLKTDTGDGILLSGCQGKITTKGLNPRELQRNLSSSGNVEYCARRIRGLRTEQPHNCAGHLVRAAGTAQRRLTTISCARPGLPPLAWISVSISPGRTAFTRMPSGPTSFARPMVRVSIAPFDAA